MLSSLPTLPDQIIHEIATYSADLEVWRMMATSRALRGAAEPVLKKLLVERKVMLEPPIVDNPMLPPHLPTTERTTATALSQKQSRFLAHLNACPLAVSSLRHLTVEVRTDLKAGWDVIERASQELETLVVHSTDERWRERDHPVYRGPSHMRRRHWDIQIDTFDKWAPPLDPSITFLSLVDLSIIATARILQHLNAFIPRVPNIRALSLSCFGGRDGTHYEPDHPPIKGLERLTVAGYSLLVLSVVSSIRHRVPDVRHLILRVDNTTQKNQQAPSVLDLLKEFPAVCPQLEGVALYGQAAYRFAELRYTAQQERRPWGDLTSLKHLVLEERADWAGGQEYAYPLLCEDYRYRPLLPALIRIIWIDRRLDLRCCLHRDSFFDRQPVKLHDSLTLQWLFEEYPTLEEVQWVNEYPQDPFLEDFGAEFEDKHLIRRIDREEAMRRACLCD